MIIITIIRYFIGLTNGTRLPEQNKCTTGPNSENEARILPAVSAGGWSFSRKLTGWDTDHVPISKYSEPAGVVHNQTLPGTPALKFNPKKIVTHEIELESKASQIYSAVFYLKETELDSWHPSKFQLSNPEFTQHSVPWKRQRLHANAKHTHPIFNQLQRYLLEKGVWLRCLGGEKSATEQTHPSPRKLRWVSSAPGGRSTTSSSVPNCRLSYFIEFFVLFSVAAGRKGAIVKWTQIQLKSG